MTDKTLVEIVARAICRERAAPACDCREKGTPCRAPLENLLYENNPVRYQSHAILAALRDPPAHVIEAGAKAMYLDLYGSKGADWRANESRGIWYQMWLASWRAALDAKE